MANESGLTLNEFLLKARGAGDNGPLPSIVSLAANASGWVWDTDGGDPPSGSEGAGHWTTLTLVGDSEQISGLSEEPCSVTTDFAFIPPWSVQKHEGPPDRRAVALLQYLLERYYQAFLADPETTDGRIVRKNMNYTSGDENLRVRYTVEFNMPGERLSQKITENLKDDFTPDGDEY